MSRSGLLLFAARCAMRIEPWVPDGATAFWSSGLRHVITAAFEPTTTTAAGTRLARELSDRGAMACNALATTDEPLGRCYNYATQTLVTAVEACGVEALPSLKKAIITTAKCSAAIPAVLAHAGRVRVPKGADPVERACVTMWDAIRADIAAVAAAVSAIERAKNRPRTLHACAALWIGTRPAWAPC